MKWLVWVLYLLPIPLGTRLYAERLSLSEADIAACDCVLVQAFGRRGMRDEQLDASLRLVAALPGLERQMQELARIGFSGDPANRALARVALRYLGANPRLVLVMQWEVCFALWKMAPTQFLSLARIGSIECLWPAGRYFSTWEVKRLSVRRMSERGLLRPLELAHHAMIVRAVMILWRLGLDPVWELNVLPYDRQSVQVWTRGPLRWIGREVPARLYHIYKGWVAFGPPK